MFCLGSYSISIGIPTIRERIAGYIKRRDGIDADPANIFLSNGASEAVKVYFIASMSIFYFNLLNELMIFVSCILRLHCGHFLFCLIHE